MFWGLIVQPNKKYSKTVSTPFHVSQAVLDTTSISDDEFVQVFLKSDKVDYILCTLRKSDYVQVPLDLIFSTGDEISFRCVGGTVHLTGYLVDDDDEFDDMNEEESSDAEEEVPTLVPAPQQKQQQQKQQQQKQQQQQNNAVQEADSSSESENSAEEDGSDDDDEEVGDDSDEEEDDSDDEIVEQPPAKIQKTNGTLNGVSKKEPKEKEPKQKDSNQKKQQQQQTQDKSAKLLVGGVKIEEVRLGHGPVAKKGQKVTVYYEGRLKSNNKLFDKTNSGKGFQFTLGKQEVIRGWDIGVPGMKVGGKRRIECPPNAAYGSKGSPPIIPPNATLVFIVELRGVN